MNVNFPLDFERRDSIRLLVMKLQALNVAKAAALLCCYRLWFDWFTAGREWRPLGIACGGNIETHSWERDSLAYVLLDASGLEISPDVFMKVAFHSGFLVLSEDGTSVAAHAFWRFNAHCDPDYKTIQQRGGEARQARRILAEVDAAAEERRRVLESQDALDFGSVAISPEEQTRCISLIMRLDRACGRAIRTNADYSAGSLLADSLKVLRFFTAEEILKVESFLVGSREDPSVIKDPAKILFNFTDYVHRASS